MVAAYFQTVGFLLYRKIIDISLIYDLFGVAAKLYWEKTKPVIMGLREQFNDPNVFAWFEYTYNEMKKREQTLQPSPPRPQ